ncbi:hypothetical protein LguiB_029356 [Lonicera macranthoides]
MKWCGVMGTAAMRRRDGRNVRRIEEGGILFGPSALGHKQLIGTKLFPARSLMILETTASFGLMFFLFSVGVQMDSSLMTKPERKAIYIGISVMLVTLVLTVALSIVLMKFVPMDATLADSLPYIAVAQCLTPFPNIACLLTELKILNTDLGRLAISSAMFCDIIGISLTAVTFAVLQNISSAGGRGGGQSLTPLWSIMSTLGVVGVIIFVVRPAISLSLSRLQPEKSLGERYINIIFIVVLLSGLASEVIGQHFVLGSLVLGLVVPEGPPLGAVIVSKLDFPIFKVLYPTYLTTSGLKTDIFSVNFQASWIVAVIVTFSCLVKIVAVLLPAHFCNLPIRDAVMLGLLLNARGAVELLLYNLWRDGKVLTNELFTLTILSAIVVTAIITPLIKFLYDPSKQHPPTKRRSIQGAAQRDEELRILVCIQSLDNVTSIINLLEASYASEESPLHATAIILVELIGRTAPMLIAHNNHHNIETNNINTSTSCQIIGALRQYVQYNENCVTLNSFSSITHVETMHHDICCVARDQKSSIVIVPFHKQFAIDGTIGSTNRDMQNMNLKVLEQAPCTVGILVDRGILNGSISILANQTPFNVAIVYIGGPDDVETLAYGNRMARKENVVVTVIRFLLFGCDNARDRKFDNDRIEEVRRAHAGSRRFAYIEEVVRDGVGLASCMRGLEDGFDLMIVGKYHSDSLLLLGLDAWNEHPELGVVGDMLASPDFGTTASVLVLQQQKVGREVVVQTQNAIGDMYNGAMRRSTTSLTPRTSSAFGNNNIATPLTTPRGMNGLNSNSNGMWSISVNRT